MNGRQVPKAYPTSRLTKLSVILLLESDAESVRSYCATKNYSPRESSAESGCRTIELSYIVAVWPVVFGRPRV